ncbi:MAG: helix-turn-helix domain-containing protein [bacterium]
MIDTNKVKELISQQGRQIDFAKKIGVAIATLNDTINNKRRPNPSTLHKIATGLQVKISDLYIMDKPDQGFDVFEDLKKCKDENYTLLEVIVKYAKENSELKSQIKELKKASDN